MSALTPKQMLDALDAVAEHVQRTIQRVDGQREELARQRIDLVLTSQRVEDLRDQVKAFALESERHMRTERHNIDSHELAARVAGGARLKALQKAAS